MLEDILAGSNSDAVKTELRGLSGFKMTLPLLKCFGKPLAIPLLSLCHRLTSIRMAQ